MSVPARLAVSTNVWLFLRFTVFFESKRARDDEVRGEVAAEREREVVIQDSRDALLPPDDSPSRVLSEQDQSRAQETLAGSSLLTREIENLKNPSFEGRSTDV